jgi:hypothetical protein
MHIIPLNPLNPLPNRERPAPRWFREDHVPAFGAGWMARQLFVHFHNLNLRFLIDDLRAGRVVAGNWTFDHDLCPVAHGVADGGTVSLLQHMTQVVGLKRACERAAEHVGASPRTIYHLVTTWDAGDLGPELLLRELEAIWKERLADAEAMQAMLSPAASLR